MFFLILDRLQNDFNQLLPCKKVSSKNYRQFVDDVKSEEEFRVKNCEKRIEEQRIKALKCKIKMENYLTEMENKK